MLPLVVPKVANGTSHARIVSETQVQVVSDSESEGGIQLRIAAARLLGPAARIWQLGTHARLVSFQSRTVPKQ
jgi:hypothetical protein